jgi:hypothetical protein
MKLAMFEWMLLPFILWGTYQGYLYYHVAQVEEALNLAVFEGQLEASTEGRYTEDIYNEMRNYLVSVHHFNEGDIEIVGTEALRVRGEYIDIQIRVPRPRLTVIPMFNHADDDTAFLSVEKRIMSEYIP